MKKEEGCQAGDVCNRNGCVGTIEAHDREGGCSCHISPPCGYCTTPSEYCDKCGWDAKEESMLYDTPTKEQEEIWDKERKERQVRDDDFWSMYRSMEVATELNYISKSHTNSSMIKQGYFPPSMSFSELFEEIKGTFGGRYKYLDREIGRFEFIAYTD